MRTISEHDREQQLQLPVLVLMLLLLTEPSMLLLEAAPVQIGLDQSVSQLRSQIASSGLVPLSFRFTLWRDDGQCVPTDGASLAACGVSHLHAGAVSVD